MRWPAALAPFVVWASVWAAPPAPAPENVLVVANAREVDSVALARHYLEARKIPEAQLFLVETVTGEDLSPAQFFAEIHQPLIRQWLAAGWLRGSEDAPDELGRANAGLLGHRIGAVVLVRGVPLRLTNDPALLALEPSAGAQPEPFRVVHASVDGELSLLALPGVPLTGPVRNPLFNHPLPRGDLADRVLRVCRLDGPTPEDVRRMLAGALAAETRGLWGRAYVDRGGPFPDGDRWLAGVAFAARAAHFDTVEDTAPGLLAAEARFDAPALYFGWYADDPAGALALPDWRFPPGAVAVHLHSFSAATLRSAERHGCGPLVARGAAATLGNVWEPYLGLTHRLDLFVERLLRGASLAEAAYFALPALGWQGVAVGDPLYRPIAKTLAEALAEAGSGRGAGHLWLREYRRRQAEDSANAPAALREGLAKAPTLALALPALADPALAPAELEPLLGRLPLVLPEEVPLALELAAAAAAAGRDDWAGRLYAAVVDGAAFAPERLRQALPPALAWAQRTGQQAYIQRWEARARALAP